MMAEGLKHMNSHRETATFGAGCFWCVEAVFSELKGVETVESGYAGGHVHNPTYEQVCTGETGHAEACRITFDPSVIKYAELLEALPDERSRNMVRTYRMIASAQRWIQRASEPQRNTKPETDRMGEAGKSDKIKNSLPD